MSGLYPAMLVEAEAKQVEEGVPLGFNLRGTEPAVELTGVVKPILRERGEDRSADITGCVDLTVVNSVSAQDPE